MKLYRYTDQELRDMSFNDLRSIIRSMEYFMTGHPSWIPVEDALPNPDDDVLVMLSNGAMAVDCTWEYEPGLIIWEGHDDNVVAWQHLPEPYVGVQK